MKKKLSLRGNLGVSLLMFLGVAIPSWGQGTTYGLTGELLTAENLTNGTLIALKACDQNNQNFIKGAEANVSVFAGASTTFLVETVGDKFRLKNVGANTYIKKSSKYSHTPVEMTASSDQAALFKAENIASSSIASLQSAPTTMVRFSVPDVNVNCLLNSNVGGAHAKWFSGKGGFSVFATYQVEANYQKPTFEENKKFRVITSSRGTLTYNAAMQKLHFVEGQGNDGDVNQHFAIVTDGGHKYLYSCGAQKFVASDYYRTGNRLTTLPVYTSEYLDAQTPEGKYDRKLQFTGGGNTNTVNINSNGVTINHYGTEDHGNRFYLKNIDETVNQETILKNAYNAAIAAVKAQNNEVTVSEGATATDAKANWSTAKTQARLKAGFYRFKGVSGNYITAGDKASNLVRNNTQSNADNIFYCGTSGAVQNLVALKNGYGLSADNVQQLGELNTADGLTLRLTDEIKYSLKGSTEYFYDNSKGFAKGATEHENAGLIAEPVTEIPVTLHGANKEATFYTPVPVTVSDGTTAYKGSVSGNTLTLTPLSGTIPANTPFFLKGTGENCTLTVTTGGASADVSGNAFKGGVKTRVQTAGMSTFVLSGSEFMLLGEGVNCRGFRAQVETTTGSGVQGFTLNFDNITAIETVETPTDNAPVFDLSGRRVAKTVKGGIYLRNGKKFVQ